MKKTTTILFLTAFCLVTNAQEETSQGGFGMGNADLPVAGDFAIGIDAVPYLEFMGNIFSGHDARNTLNIGTSTLFARYFLTDLSAVRAELYVNRNTSYSKSYVQDDANVAQNPLAQVEDLRKMVSRGIGIGTGYQVFRDMNKVRGTVGVTVSYYFDKLITEYQWGNQMTAANTNPTSTNWYGGGTNPASRQLMNVNSGSHFVNGGIFAGFEYFFLPKISIGGELGIYGSYNLETQDHLTYETVQQGNVVTYEQAVNPSGSNISFTTRMYDNGFNAGRLYLMVHF
ncbi:MAG: hypothetical protein WD052_06290 [Bacteroidales bacterium]